MGLPLAQVDVKAAVRFGQIKTIAAKVAYRGSVSGSVMEGMMVGIPDDKVTDLGIDQQGAVLDTIGADFLGSQGSGFGDIAVAETTFDQISATVEPGVTEALASQDFFSGVDLFSEATTVPNAAGSTG